MGVEIGHRLRWKQHINHIYSAANRMLREIYVSVRKASKRRYMLRVTLVRPKLQYVSVAWDPYFKCDIVKLEGVQRAAARFYKNDYDWSSSVMSMMFLKNC